MLVAERAERENQRERIGPLRHEADVRKELDNIREAAKGDGIVTGPGLATLQELQQHARRSKMGMSTMAAISATQSALAEFWGERATLVSHIEEAASAYDTVDELRRSVRMRTCGSRPAQTMFLQAAKSA